VSAFEATSWSSDKSWERFHTPQSFKSEEELNVKMLRKYQSNFRKQSTNEDIFPVDIEPVVNTSMEIHSDKDQICIISPTETKFMAESFIQHSELSVFKTLIPRIPEITTMQQPTTVRVGHSKILEGMFLISNGEPIWEPLTQMPLLMTEDMLQEQEIFFTSLGTSSQGTERRAKIQSAQLISGINHLFSFRYGVF
jgi:hypothetical protein